MQTSTIEETKRRLLQAFDYLFEFEGFGKLEVDLKILKRGQKEILIRGGREYRFIVDTQPATASTQNSKKTADVGSGFKITTNTCSEKQVD